MKKLMAVVAVAAMVLMVAVGAQAQTPATSGPVTCPMVRSGGHLMGGPGVRGGKGMAVGGLGLMRGTVEVNRESKAAWDKITRLQTQMRNKQWELFALRSQGAGEEQLQAKLTELRGLTEQLRAAREEFRQFVTVPEGAGPGQAQGMQGRRMHRRGMQGGQLGVCPFRGQAAPDGGA